MLFFLHNVNSFNVIFVYYLIVGGGYPAYEQPPPNFRQGGQQGSFNGSSGGNGYGGPPASGYGGPGNFGGNLCILIPINIFIFMYTYTINNTF